MRTPKERTPNRRRTFGTILALMLVVALALTGTYAFTSLNQQALNEVQGDGRNPGGRIRDDFDGDNKDVYAENFGNTPLYVRIMLTEYMEIGGVPFATGATRGNMNSWTPHNPTGDVNPADCENADANKFHDYWEWTMGGEKIFMPTFNRDRNSIKTDYTGKDSWSLSSPDFDHRVSDPNAGMNDGVGNFLMARPGAHDQWEDGETFTSIQYRTDGNSMETHTAKPTISQDRAPITMAQWVALGSPSGNFWVIDTDGWAYWAAPLEQGEATSLLLCSIRMIQTPEDEWYYAINVVV